MESVEGKVTGGIFMMVQRLKDKKVKVMVVLGVEDRNVLIRPSPSVR
jgi:hypothetical protein